MKKSFFLMAALLVAMTGCNKEPQMESADLSPDAKVYMSFSIQTLATRTGTDASGDTNSDASPDYEVGFAKENKISSLDIVLRNANSYVCATVSNPTPGTDNTWVAEFNSNLLSTNTDYQVYIYANCSAKQDVNAISNATIGEMTSDNGFWMTNAYAPATVNKPSFSTDKNNPTDLGTHYVERAMARFDYMPKGPYTLTAQEVNHGEVSPLSIETMDLESAEVQVELTHAALINQSTEFYMLRRVSSDGTATGWNVGGVETPMNYVVDADYADKKDGYGEGDVDNFICHLSTPEDWQWESILPEDLTQADNWNGVNDGTDDPLAGANGKEESTPEHDLNEYYVWQYCKENTIPGADLQLNGFSTGVVFKGLLSGTNVPTGEDATEPIYVFDNVLYGTWAQVREAAEYNESLKFYTDKFGETINMASESKALGEAGFTAYKPDKNDGNYYTYYYYWNRHNDNGNNTSMGMMEFAVVRNNVYKLCVDNILKFGHPDPNDPDPVDPDPVDPTDPDEKGEYYFKVTAKVLPWVVRVNHIEF